MQTREVVEDLHNFREFSQPLECLDEAMWTRKKVFYCSYKMILDRWFCIGNLLNSRQRKSFDVVKSSLLLLDQGLSGFKMFWPVWTSPNLNSMRWLGLFTNKTFRKHRKLIFCHFIICKVSLAIVHPHFDILIFPSAFYHPHFSIRIFLSAIRHPPSAIRRHPVRTLQRPLKKAFPLASQTNSAHKHSQVAVLR